MPKDGSKTKTKILDITTQLVLENGLAGTSIDNILEKTEITKGAFFYHFKSKAELALKLMEQFAKNDIASLNHALEATKKFEHQPKKRLLEFVRVFIDAFSGLKEPYPGCLYASFVHETEQFSPDIKDIVSDALLAWRRALIDIMQSIDTKPKGKSKIDYDSLADLFSVILEGAFITSKALNDPELTPKQLKHYQKYLDLLFDEE